MKIHFIAIGGSAMHNLAIALSRKGYSITGSDDEIFDPSQSRLAAEGILPDQIGWDPERVTNDIDAVILGMHARADNPELARARELGLKIYSYPEFVYEQTQDELRVVIGGSHGKTSITSMLLHVMHTTDQDPDYLVGALLEGFDCMVKLTEDADVAILEGDEYLSSPIDRRPKFHLYKPNIAVISGIAWDHINVFPTWENYVEQFSKFIDVIEPGGCLIYYGGDPTLLKLVATGRDDISYVPYEAHPATIENGVTKLITKFGEVPLKVFGDHNLQNLMAALEVSRLLGMKDEVFFKAIRSFSGASRRLELIKENKKSVVYKDFAHSPSKLKATTEAVKSQFPERELIACMELHTFSSLNKDFLDEYDGAMRAADRAIVYYNPKTIEHKKLEAITPDTVKRAFSTENVEVFTSSDEVVKTLRSVDWKGKNLLMMTSGNFDGVDIDALGKELIDD